MASCQRRFLELGLTAFLGFLAVLPLLSMLLILGTSSAALYRIHSPEHFIHSPEIVSLRRVTAGVGLAFQLLFDVLVFQIFLIGYARTDIAWGLVVVLHRFRCGCDWCMGRKISPKLRTGMHQSFLIRDNSCLVF